MDARSGEVEFSGAFQMNTGGDRGGQRPVPEQAKLDTARVFARCGQGKHFFRLQIQKAQTHGTVAQNAFQVASPTAAAEGFVVVQGDYAVTGLPNASGYRIVAKPDADAQGPDAGELVHALFHGRDAGGEGV